MVDICHRIAVANASPTSVYEALTTIEGLAGWWTTDTTGDAAEGGVIAFRFPPGGFDMKVLETTPAERVRWEVVSGPDEWVGNTIDWRLRPTDDWTVVLFEHQGWAEPVEFMDHCSTKWATYLMSLTGLLETGTATAPRTSGEARGATEPDAGRRLVSGRCLSGREPARWTAATLA